MSLATFKEQFRFNSARTGFVGVERECFIGNQTNAHVVLPRAPEILSFLAQKGVPSAIGGYDPIRPNEFGYELSACQIESRIGPSTITNLEEQLVRTDGRLGRILGHFGLQPLHTEVGPADMPLDVYPDPAGRYASIVQHMPREVLLAACRVIATHIHIGMPSYDAALKVYNSVIAHCRELCVAGDGSYGERLAIYRQMAPDAEPSPYGDWEEYHQRACMKGFVEDPRKCWTLIRISVHGTIEFRMFGATGDIGRIVGWAERCHDLCMTALEAA